MNGSGIYEILHVASGKRYIGSAKNFHKRWIAHRNHLRRGTHHAPHLQHSWSKHGENSFEFKVLEHCEPEHLVKLEQVWIDWFSPAFNVCPTAGSSLGRAHSSETRSKISAKHLGRKHAPRSEEYRQKLSKVHTGKKKSAEHNAALQAGRAARVYTEEQRQAISDSLRKSYASGERSRERPPEYRNKIGKAFARLSDDAIREIRRRRDAGESGASLAREFNCPNSTISEIHRRIRYKWVE